MEKLLELLNEYMPNMKWEERRNWTEIFTNIHNSNLFICYTERVISKRFGFIEWLYNHKKMTLERLKISDLYWDINDWVWAVDNIIMHLSISENPIEFLISMLK